MSPTPAEPSHLVVAVVAALFGVAAGGVLGWGVRGEQVPPATSEAVSPESPEPVEVVRDYTDAELRIACLPYMRQTATTLEEAQVRVDALSLQIRETEAEIARLEARTDGPDPDATSSRLAEARTELAALRESLEMARAEKSALLVDLEQTKEELEAARDEVAAQRADLLRTREDAIDQRWRTFLADAQIRICERGSRLRIERCREQVAAVLSPQRLRYESCVRSGQAVPSLAQLGAGETPPTFAEFLDPDDRFLADWYVLFCDPALPEAGGEGEPLERDDPARFRRGALPQPRTEGQSSTRTGPDATGRLTP